jgi:hypothetical protein
MLKSNIVRASVFAGLLACPLAAAAQPPVVVGRGLVNVQVTDVIDDVIVNVEDINVNVGAALELAANVCGVSVNVLASQLGTGTATCDSLVDGTGSIVTINR